MKAVAFDLDDTLLHDDLSVSQYTLNILHSLRKLGIYLIPSSGRAQMSMKPFLDILDCATFYISCNGAEIWDGKSHRLIRRELFSEETAKEIARFGNRHSCYSQTYDGDKFLFSEYSVWAKKYADTSMLTGEYVGNLEEYIHGPLYKILMMVDESKIASMLNEAQKQFAGKVSVTCSKPYFLEFNPLEATKGIAIRRVSDMLHIDTSDIIAFGDSLNDLSMLQTAGVSVVVSNGRNDVKPYCTAVCGSNNNDGVAHYLADYFSLRG